MNLYHLFLDETKIVNKKSESNIFVYSVAGVIINNNDLHNVRVSMAHLKYSLWNNCDEFSIEAKDRIFHESEIRSAKNSV